MTSDNEGKPRIGRPPKILTEKELKQVEMLAGIGLTVPLISAFIGISEREIRDRMGGDDALSAVLERGRARAQEKVGTSLFERAIGGDVAAIRWWETTRAGYTLAVRNEMTGANGGPIKTQSLSPLVLVIGGKTIDPIKLGWVKDDG